MATASKPVTYPHISVDPGVRGGRPCIDGTRLTVMDIVTLEKMGPLPEEMRTYYSSRPVTLAEASSGRSFRTLPTRMWTAH
jgi:uncharacterized protein (DUF433 family)